jgi:hypothetical protein
MIELDRIEPLRANMGGPMSRARDEVLRAIVVGRDADAIHCPEVCQVCIDWGGEAPVAALPRLFARHGIEDPEALRTLATAPARPLLCVARPRKYAPKLSIDEPGQQAEVLTAVLILALATDHLYDPARPLLLLDSRLERNLFLYDGEGFYA